MLIDSINSMFADSGLAGLWFWMNNMLALDERQLIFVIATPIFIGVALWEYMRVRHNPLLMNVPEALRNFALGAGYQLTELVFAGLIAFPLYALVYRYRLFDLELNWMTALLTVIGADFCFYWMHRTSHRVRWFWAAHVVHHSSERMNFTTAMRQNATNIFNGGWTFYLPLALIGLNPVWIGIAFALSLVYQFFIHTTLISKLHSVIELVFNTPSHHRAHHGRNPEYIDRNFGGVLIIWDRLFGTFEPENELNPPEYGIVRQVQSTNLFRLWTHEYVDMFRDVRRSKSLKHLWMPPEWEGSSTTPASR